MAKGDIEIGPTGQTVAENMTYFRTEHARLTLVQVSNRTARAGRPLSVSALSLIATGKRRVDVDDLMVLATALDVDPLTLMMPRPGKRKRVDATGFPKGVARQRLLEWLTGRQDPVSLSMDGLSRHQMMELILELALKARPE